MGTGNEVECFSGGIIFIKGMVEAALPGYYDMSVDENVSVQAILAGRGGVRVAGSLFIREGDLVGLRAPAWETDNGGSKWVIAVEWVVL